MITNVYVIRKNMDKFFVIDPDTGNWEWSMNLDDATIYDTSDEANSVKLQKRTGEDSWIFEMPYYKPTITQSRKKRKIKKSPTKRKIIRKISKQKK